MPVRVRGGGAAVPSSPTKASRAGLPPALPAAAAARPGRVSTGSSTIVFHSPHASQRPAHLGVTAAQFWQT